MEEKSKAQTKEASVVVQPLLEHGGRSESNPISVAPSNGDASKLNSTPGEDQNTWAHQASGMEEQPENYEKNRGEQSFQRREKLLLRNFRIQLNTYNTGSSLFIH